MSFITQCVLGALAAVGFICILKSIYDIIYINYYSTPERAELYLCGDGTDASVEQLLGAALQVRRLYLHGLEIIFIDTSNDESAFNYAASICGRRDITYLK